MSKNITVKQDGEVQEFAGVTHIRTNLDGGGSADWIPVEDALSMTKKINKNGEFIAMERDSVLGYSAVYIDVPVHRVIGKAEDGNTYEVKKDENGYLQYIQITE